MSLPAIADAESLARFIPYKTWIRADRTVRPDAFIPSDGKELSVTRLLNLSEAQIMHFGKLAIGGLPRQLHGRAEVTVGDVKREKLDVKADPIFDLENPSLDNPNHANIVNWSNAKDARKAQAMEVARVSRFIGN